MMSSKSTIYLFQEHQELLPFWREHGIREINLWHFDAHCDMHGLLVDRRNAYGRILPGLENLDCGNFISFAVKEGIVKEITWIYDQYGGREKDSSHVKYSSDLSAVPFLIKDYFRPAPKHALQYNVMDFNDIRRLETGENGHLDIDWDVFALKDKPENERDRTINAFLDIDFATVPSHIYVTYSADYVSPTRKEFTDFVGKLQRKFEASVVECAYPEVHDAVPSAVTNKYLHGIKWRFKKYLHRPVKQFAKKFGVY